MIRLTNTQIQPIGLDIGSDSIKMLQLETNGESLSIHAAARLAIPEDARESAEVRRAVAVDLIRQMLRQTPFHGRRLVASLPREIVHVKNLRLPIMPPDELAAAVEFEARAIFPFDTDSAYVRFLRAGEVRQGGDTKQEVIVVAARQDDVDNFLEQLHRCGAIVESLDFEPCAIYRGVERFFRRREDEHEVNVLIDVGLRCSHVIIGRGKDISFVKPVEVGGRQMNEAVSRKLSITLEEARALRQRISEANISAPDEGGKRDPVRQAVFDATRSIMEQLGREISLCLRYFSVTFRGQRPAKVRLIGGEANDAQLQTVLNGILPVPAEPAKLLQSVSIGRMKPIDQRGALCEWSVAFGLGLKMTTGRFASRDGKPRDPFTPRVDALSPQAELVDLNRAVSRADIPPASEANSVKAEGAHA